VTEPNLPCSRCRAWLFVMALKWCNDAPFCCDCWPRSVA
jgi:hypothetical protein